MAAKCLELAQSLWMQSMTRGAADGESVGVALLISLLNSLLLLDSADAVGLGRNLQLMSQSLSLQKEVIITRNESVHNGEELQLLKSRYYLRLSQLNVLKSAAADDEALRKKYEDKARR